MNLKEQFADIGAVENVAAGWPPLAMIVCKNLAWLFLRLVLFLVFTRLRQLNR